MLPLRTLVRIAVMASLGLCLMMLGIPILPAAPYLRYDPGDVPVLLMAFAFGPWAGVGVAALKSALFVLTSGVGLESLVGAPLNFLWGASFALTAGSVDRTETSQARAAWALAAGGLVATIVLAGANLILLPWFLDQLKPGAGAQVTLHFVLTIIVPFNLVKAVLTSSLCFAVYKRVAPLLKGTRDR